MPLVNQSKVRCTPKNLCSICQTIHPPPTYRSLFHVTPSFFQCTKTQTKFFFSFLKSSETTTKKIHKIGISKLPFCVNPPPPCLCFYCGHNHPPMIPVGAPANSIFHPPTILCSTTAHHIPSPRLVTDSTPTLKNLHPAHLRPVLHNLLPRTLIHSIYASLPHNYKSFPTILTNPSHDASTKLSKTQPVNKRDLIPFNEGSKYCESVNLYRAGGIPVRTAQ
jgi:hypothetical protein